tara:strand:+ start:1546 stop:1782 length:237 start_codon:yes stop_codon:yes gene_type:complete
MKEYNGHRSWNAWNVALWLSNDYDVCKQIENCVQTVGLKKAINIYKRAYRGLKTPDGADYNRLSIKLAIEGMEIEEND